MTSTDALAAIAATVQQYFEGMHLGDTSRLRKAFHADAFLVGYYHGALSRVSLEEWMAEVESLPKPVAQGEPFDMRIVATDITGQIASVKVAVLYMGLRFTDYLTLLEADGRWQVIHKAYHHD